MVQQVLQRPELQKEVGRIHLGCLTIWLFLVNSCFGFGLNFKDWCPNT